MRSWVAILGVAMLATLGALGAIHLGLPDVAATTPHWKVTERVLATAMENAVRRRAAGILVPDDLDDPARLRAGASAYHDMCVDCHAAPGVEAGVVAYGLLPNPPELRETAEEWSAAELFWITKHGVRMTGMPAFGPTHADREIWDIVALLRRLPKLSAAEYRSLVEGPGAGPRHEHEHDERPEHEHSH